MSNIKTETLQYNTDYVKKEISTNEITIKSEYEKTYTDQPGLTQTKDNHSQHHHDKEHSCYYNTTSSVPNTILITNNYSQNAGDADGVNNTNIKKSSITIVTHNSDTEHSTNTSMPSSANSSTVVLDRIKICINNHFNDPRASVQNSPLGSEKRFQNDIPGTADQSETSQNTLSVSVINPSHPRLIREHTEPDSTTSNEETSSINNEFNNENAFSNGQDVLVQRKDGRYYLGTIVATGRSRYLVKFDDNTEYWSSHDELKKFGLNDSTNSDPVCVVCKKVSDDVVEVCEKCGRGYHQNCAEGFQKNGIWYCRRCTARNAIKYKNNERRSEEKSRSYNKKEDFKPAILHNSQLPYNTESLSWDTHHRVNLEQIYCYCGGNGEWYNKMLQCVKCLQWFHEKCIKSIEYPLYCGDRFYIFACTMCNHGQEFLRRLQMKLEDLIHLLLFNLTIKNQKKYYHVNKVIVPYAIDNWPMLQLSKQLRNLTTSEIRENIINTLPLHSSSFKCGREIKKRLSVWGLRSRIPPPAPILHIPLDVTLSEQYLKQVLKLNFVSTRSFTNIPKDIDSRMSGAAYMGENSDNESSTSDQKLTSDDELPLKVIKEKEEKAREQNRQLKTKAAECNDNTRLTSLSMNDDSSTANDFCTMDSSDKSHDFVEYQSTKETEPMDIDENTKLDAFELSSSLSRIKRSRKRKSPFLSTFMHQAHHMANGVGVKSEIIDICDSSDETSSPGTLDLIIPPPKNFQGRNNPFRLTPKKKDQNNENIIRRQMKQPVYSLLNGNNGNCIAGDPNQAAGQFRIVRTVKRRLSVKDIMIGPNKEVKRRRLRRRSGNVEVISEQTLDAQTIQCLPKSVAYLPIRSETKDLSVSAIRSTLNSANSSASSTPQATTPTNLGSITNVFNGRCLRQRQEKNYSESLRRNSNPGLNTANATIGAGISIPGSPNKSNSGSDVSLSQLQTTVNMYFGAANRIANGEHFVVRAKRLGPNGKVQYLIEWEAKPNEDEKCK